MSSKITLLFCTLFAPVTVLGQPFVFDADTLSGRLQRQLMLYPQEKIYVHTDKDFYMAGDTVWFRAHVAEASTLAPVWASRYVYAELQSSGRPASGEEPPAPVRMRIRERDGLYAGYFALPITAATGDYTLTAYTSFMRNAGPDYFYRKNLRVGAYGKRLEAPDARHAADRAFEVSFHPEGGYLLAGVRCCVGFKALRGDGTAARVTGRIEDDRGVEVVRFESRHAGLGKLFFTPEAGRSYTAVCRNEATGEQRRFRLAAMQSEGCIVQVFPASERFTVQVAAPAGQDTRGLGLLIHCRGRLCWAGAWEGRPLSFARDRFPDGVLQVLLLDAAGRSLSERLLFCYDPRRQPAIAVRTDKPAYGRREKITVHLRCTDAAGNPCGGDSRWP